MPSSTTIAARRDEYVPYDKHLVWITPGLLIREATNTGNARMTGNLIAVMAELQSHWQYAQRFTTESCQPDADKRFATVAVRTLARHIGISTTSCWEALNWLIRHDYVNQLESEVVYAKLDNGQYAPSGRWTRASRYALTAKGLRITSMNTRMKDGAIRWEAAHDLFDGRALGQLGRLVYSATKGLSTGVAEVAARLGLAYKTVWTIARKMLACGVLDGTVSKFRSNGRWSARTPENAVLNAGADYFGTIGRMHARIEQSTQQAEQWSKARWDWIVEKFHTAQESFLNTNNYVRGTSDRFTRELSEAEIEIRQAPELDEDRRFYRMWRNLTGEPVQHRPLVIRCTSEFQNTSEAGVGAESTHTGSVCALMSAAA
jgi:hypothetical protein